QWSSVASSNSPCQEPICGRPRAHYGQTGVINDPTEALVNAQAASRRDELRLDHPADTRPYPRHWTRLIWPSHRNDIYPILCRSRALHWISAYRANRQRQRSGRRVKDAAVRRAEKAKRIVKPEFFVYGVSGGRVVTGTDYYDEVVISRKVIDESAQRRRPRRAIRVAHIP